MLSNKQIFAVDTEKMFHICFVEAAVQTFVFSLVYGMHVSYLTLHAELISYMTNMKCLCRRKEKPICEQSLWTTHPIQSLRISFSYRCSFVLYFDVVIDFSEYLTTENGNMQQKGTILKSSQWLHKNRKKNKWFWFWNNDKSSINPYCI